MVDNAKYSFIFKTVQAGTIRTLVEALKEVLNDVNLTFNEHGIQLIAMDGAKAALIHLKLVQSSFEYYYCERRVSIGINMQAFFKLLKTIGSSDNLSIFMHKDDNTELGIRVENKEKNMVTESFLKLLDIDEDILRIPNIEFDSVIAMPSTDFQKICRDMGMISDVITIANKEKKFTLECVGDFAKQVVTIGEAINGLTFSKQIANVSGVFSLKYINLFTKSSNLCSTVELFIKNDYPLVLLYSVANLGSLKYCLAPKQTET